MANPVWTGTVSFGLVSLAVRAFPGVERHGPVSHLFVRGTSDRVRYQRIDERSGAAVQPESIATGFEREGPDRYVLISPEELEAIQPVRSRTLQIESFVAVAGVEALRYDSTYYLEPDRGGTKAYDLLHAALMRTGRAGLGRMILRQRERLVLITPQQGVLSLATLYWPDEIRAPEDVMRPPSDEVDDEQLDLGLQLVDAMAIDWDPDAYQDEYQRRLEELIEAKAAGRTLSYGSEPSRPRGTVVDLDTALRESVEQRMAEQRARRAGHEAGHRGPQGRQDRGSSKKELLERARQLGIPGRSRMSRAELSQALERAQTAS